MYKVESSEPLPAGDVTLKLSFDYDGGGVGKGGEARLFVNDKEVAKGRIEKTIPYLFSMSGETFDVGEDTGAPVGPYEHEFPFTGKIKKVQIDLRSEQSATVRQAMRKGQMDAALKSQRLK
ncbi:MAG TPA: hypothetical protein VE715_22610 [Blastocatellia bacterium]|nr:hypothetical protein [Blastocatellia bacterium]